MEDSALRSPVWKGQVAVQAYFTLTAKLRFSRQKSLWLIRRYECVAQKKLPTLKPRAAGEVMLVILSIHFVQMASEIAYFLVYKKLIDICRPI